MSQAGDTSPGRSAPTVVFLEGDRTVEASPELSKQADYADHQRQLIRDDPATFGDQSRRSEMDRLMTERIDYNPDQDKRLDAGGAE